MFGYYFALAVRSLKRSPGLTALMVLAIGFNLMLMNMFVGGQRLPIGYIAIGVVVILLLGQLAVFVPARRASNVPPVVATRSV